MNGSRTPRRRRAAKVVAGILAAALLVVLGSAILGYANVDTVRNAVTNRLAALTGREAKIAGEFSLAPSLTPTLTAEGVSIANADWGSQPLMLTAERVSVEIQLIPLLLRREARIDRIAISGAELLVETGPRGAVNWDLSRARPAGGAGSGPRPALAISNLAVRDSRIAWRRGSGKVETATLERLVWQGHGRDSHTALEAAGRYGGLPFSIDARLDASATFGARPLPLPVRATIEYGSTVLSTERKSGTGAAAQGARFAVALSGSDPAPLTRLLDRPLPELGPWSLHADIMLAEEAIAVSDIRARIGEESGPAIEIRDGAVARLLDGEGLSLPLTATGESLAAAGRLFGIDLPAIGPFEMTGRVTGSIEAPHLADFGASIGKPETTQLRIAGASIDDLRAGLGLHVPFAARGETFAALASYVGWDAPFGPWTAQGTIAGSVEAPGLRNLNARTTRDGAAISLSGSVADLRAPAGLELSLSGEGPRLGALSPLIGTELPANRSFEASAALRGSAETLALEDVSVRLGETSIDGAFRLDRSSLGVPKIDGRVAAQRIDLDELWRLARESGGAPEANGTGGGPPLRLGWLDRADAELDVRAQTIVAEGRTFSNAQATVLLRDGQLAVRDLTAGIAGGAVTAEGRMETGADSMAEIVLRVNVEDLDAAKLLSSEVPGRVRGVLDIDLNIDARGRTLDALAANLDGDAAIFAEQGELQDVPLNRLIPDLDITRILPFLRGRDSAVRINCLIGEFDIESGVAHADSMMDTTRMTLFGRGAVDLDEGTLDFSIRPVAKGRKLSQAAVPVDIEGDLADPEIQPRVRESVGGAVRGILGGLLVPLNQLTALFGEDAKSACIPALRQARERSRNRTESR